MKTGFNRRKSAKWLLSALVISAAVFGNGADVGATLAAKGVTVDGKVCSETERRNFADGWADSIAERYPVAENVRGHENIEWSVSYAFHLTDENKDLPRVLLVGHSTCQGYQGKVRSKLEGKANVTYWTSSYCVTSPGFLRLLAFYLDEAKYDVVHFNNGGHSGQTPIPDYEKSYRDALVLVRRKQPDAKLLWSSSTPLNTEDAARVEKVVQLNDAARRAAQGVGGVLENDLFALMDPLERSKYWTDAHHFKDAGYELIASQVVEKVTAAMPAARR